MTWFADRIIEKIKENDKLSIEVNLDAVTEQDIQINQF